MLSKLTIAGLNEFTDGQIFDELELPEGLDKDVLITEIIRQCSEFSVLYTDPSFLKLMIGSWSKKWFHNFDRWNKAYNFDYNALYNLDVEATYIDDNKTHNSGNSTTKNTGDVKHTKAGYNSSALQNALADVNDLTNHSEGSSDIKIDNVRTEKRFGNQGVTMSQDMLNAEYSVWQQNIYKMIAEVFAVEFCIVIYD